MATELEKIRTELMALPKETRAWLAKTLIESLDEVDDANIDELWAEEIQRRDDEVKTGEVFCESVDEVLKEANNRLKCSKP